MYVTPEKGTPLGRRLSVQAIACSRRSDSRAREKNSRKRKKKAETRGGKGKGIFWAVISCGLFPKGCDSLLIPDAVKNRFSVTSVKALIFLLRLKNFTKYKIFLPFWASINDLTRTPSFHMAVLWLLLLFFQITWASVGFIMATRGATMMIVEIDSPTFPVITFIIRGKSRKMKVSYSPLEE